ncbi:MAG TPA: outer membrane beta-barrel protein [Gemmatimonadota bacterium]|nr:outer membrane beta-barrel protein [Gemmatimonadota bacterium]
MRPAGAAPGGVLAALGLLAALAGPAAALSQEPPVALPGSDAPAPPPGGIVGPERHFALGAVIGTLRWDDDAPYDDGLVWGLSLERRLWSFIRGRAGLTAGSTSLVVEGGEVDVWAMEFDLQVVVGADVGPLADLPVVPYAVAGVGSLVTNPTGDGAGELPTRSQSRWSWGGGVRARIAERWEARAEATSRAVRLADPTDGENLETDTIHNLRMEGSLQWLL